MQRMDNGDLVLLIVSGKRFLVQLNGEPQKVSGLGVVDTSRLIGKSYGERIELAGSEMIAIPRQKEINLVE